MTTDTLMQPATCNTLTPYGGSMPDAPQQTQATRDVLAECDNIERIMAELEQARERRNAAIVRMHTEDGMTAPQIERATGKRVSKSSVRNIAAFAGIKL